MADFPALGNPLNGFKEGNINKTIKSNFNGNYTQTRKVASRTRKSFSCDYILTQAQYQTLVTFFNTYVGSNFNFTHPVTSTVYFCFFTIDSLYAIYTTDDFIKVSIQMEEV